MGTIIIKASFLQIYIKHLKSLVYNELQTPIKLFPWLGYVMKASPPPGFRAVWRARPHMLSPTVHCGKLLLSTSLVLLVLLQVLVCFRDQQQALNYVSDSLLHKLFWFMFTLVLFFKKIQPRQWRRVNDSSVTWHKSSKPWPAPWKVWLQLKEVILKIKVSASWH